jgi:hypothetical protein
MTSLAPIVFKTAIEKHESIYFVGSTEKALVNFIGIIKVLLIHICKTTVILKWFFFGLNWFF